MAQAVTNPGTRLAGLIADLGHKLRSGSLTEEQLALFLSKQNPFKAEEEKAGGSGGLLVVPADLAFEERIRRGNYDWRKSDLIEQRFPVTADQIGEWEWKLFNLNRSLSSKGVIRLMKGDGFEPGQTGHILTFGEKYPEEQRKYPIIGLGSVAKVNLDLLVPELCGDDVERGLRLNWFVDNWHGVYRFLGVRRHSVV